MALPPPGPNSTCLVTGASSGLGADMARELAKRGHNVVISARREDRLQTLAEELSKDCGVRAEAVACDVTDADSRASLIEKIASDGLDVEVLVNNAGYGSGGRFQDLDGDKEVQMVKTNCEAVVAFCVEYVPGMIERGRGAILNVGSTAGYQPLPRQATYAATKAFVNSFSDALSADLHGTGITVTSLRPGPVATEFGESSGMDDEFSSLPGFAIQTAGEVAAAAIEALDRGKRVVHGGTLPALTMAGQYAPRGPLLAALRRFYPVK
jgi:short-subunit dehydrogenase